MPIEMRKHIMPLLAILLLASCQDETEPTPPIAPAATPLTMQTGKKQETWEMMQAELRYYLERHNVQDEGYDMVARYAEEGDSTLAAYRPEGRVTVLNTIRLSGLRREGKGITKDSYGRVIIGRFHADTLVSGLRMDRRGTYAGTFNAAMEATGHGSYRSTDGSYYEGHWEQDRREGFGFCVSPTNLRAGWWHKGQFRGERMQYTTERIYGIDISRYQHEKGRRVYPIKWKRLRIHHLGKRISEQRVKGSPDYPVRFVYIKSTQGITILNKYYTADRQGCRQANIPVGAYHFFSTKCGGVEQAAFFLANTTMGSGDLPPMLDIEPGDKQIDDMGGAEEMFRQIRAWLTAVEAGTGTKPLLYANQRFVNKYLDMAPDLKSGYHFWIARYGEYKPDIHLALWQLSDGGKVAGIHGEVDLNVFNGYEAQWQEFLKEATVK